MLGVQESNVSKSIIFQAKKCNNETRKKGEPVCASERAIDRYIKDITIKTWSQEKQIDFSKHSIEPTLWSLSAVSQTVIYPDYL